MGTSGCSRRPSQVVGGLGNDLYDAAFAMAGEMAAGVVARPVWQDPLVVAATRAAPLLAHKRVPLDEVVGYPLVLCHPQVCQECSRQYGACCAWCRRSWPVTTHSLMLALVAAMAWDFHRGARGGMPAGGRDRPAAGQGLGVDDLPAHQGVMSEPLRHFIDRAQRVGHAVGYATYGAASGGLGRCHFGQGARPVLS